MICLAIWADEMTLGCFLAVVALQDRIFGSFHKLLAMQFAQPLHVAYHVKLWKDW